MAEFEIKPEVVNRKLDSLDNVVSMLENCRDGVESVASSLSFSGAYASIVRHSLKASAENISQLKSKTTGMRSGLEQISSKYVATENKICNNSKNGSLSVGSKISSIANDIINDLKWIQDGIPKNFNIGDTYPSAIIASMIANSILPPAFMGAKSVLDLLDTSINKGVSISKMNEEVILSGKYGEVQADGGILNADANVGVNGYGENEGIGIKANADASVSVAEGNVSYSGDYGSIGAAVSLITASIGAAADAGIGLNKNGYVTAKAEVSASAAVAVAKGDVNGQLGIDDYNVHGGAEGAVLGAGAEAKAGVSVSEDGSFKAEAKAGAEAYLAKGEVKGGFTFLGIKFDAKAEGMIGVQAEAGAEVTSSSASGNIGIGPVGLDVSIDWSGFELPKVELPKLKWPLF